MAARTVAAMLPERYRQAEGEQPAGCPVSPGSESKYIRGAGQKRGGVCGFFWRAFHAENAQSCIEIDVSKKKQKLLMRRSVCQERNRFPGALTYGRGAQCVYTLI